tara:strand:+ start:538 stop:678 length:141 start_codon:yes stop_codon:yes gene_type:complete
MRAAIEEGVRTKAAAAAVGQAKSGAGQASALFKVVMDLHLQLQDHP